MFLNPEEITTLRAELTRLGLIDRIDFNGYDQTCLDEAVTTAGVAAEKKTGRLFVVSGGGHHIFDWACVSSGKNRFALATGFAVIVCDDYLRLTRWA